MCTIKYSIVPAALLALFGDSLTVGAFSPQQQSFRQQVRTSTAIQTTDQNEDVVLYSDDWEDGVPPPAKSAKNKNRWNALSPAVKAKIVKEAQQRAIRNKKKNESSSDKKRRKSLSPVLSQTLLIKELFLFIDMLTLAVHFSLRRPHVLHEGHATEEEARFAHRPRHVLR